MFQLISQSNIDRSLQTPFILASLDSAASISLREIHEQSNSVDTFLVLTGTQRHIQKLLSDLVISNNSLSGKTEPTYHKYVLSQARSYIEGAKAVLKSFGKSRLRPSDIKQMIDNSISQLRTPPFVDATALADFTFNLSMTAGTDEKDWLISSRTNVQLSNNGSPNELIDLIKFNPLMPDVVNGNDPISILLSKDIKFQSFPQMYALLHLLIQPQIITEMMHVRYSGPITEPGQITMLVQSLTELDYFLSALSRVDSVIYLELILYTINQMSELLSYKVFSGQQRRLLSDARQLLDEEPTQSSAASFIDTTISNLTQNIVPDAMIVSSELVSDKLFTSGEEFVIAEPFDPPPEIQAMAVGSLKDDYEQLFSRRRRTLSPFQGLRTEVRTLFKELFTTLEDRYELLLAERVMESDVNLPTINSLVTNVIAGPPIRLGPAIIEGVTKDFAASNTDFTKAIFTSSKIGKDLDRAFDRIIVPSEKLFKYLIDHEPKIIPSFVGLSEFERHGYGTGYRSVLPSTLNGGPILTIPELIPTSEDDDPDKMNKNAIHNRDRLNGLFGILGIGSVDAFIRIHQTAGFVPEMTDALTSFGLVKISGKTHSNRKVSQILQGRLRPFGLTADEAWDKMTDDDTEFSLSNGVVIRPFTRIPRAYSRTLTTLKLVAGKTILSATPVEPLTFNEDINFFEVVPVPFGAHTVLMDFSEERDIITEIYTELFTQSVSRPIAGPLPTAQRRTIQTIFDYEVWHGVSDHPEPKIWSLTSYDVSTSTPGSGTDTDAGKLLEEDNDTDRKVGDAELANSPDSGVSDSDDGKTILDKLLADARDRANDSSSETKSSANKETSKKELSSDDENDDASRKEVSGDDDVSSTDQSVKKKKKKKNKKTDDSDNAGDEDSE